MSLLVPSEGESRLHTDLLAGGTLENWTLKLYSNNYTPAKSDTSASYTEATFTGYSSKTLTRSISSGTWQSVTQAAPTGGWSAQATVAKSTYGSSAQTWTASSSQTIYGYYVVGATSGKVIFAEIFSSAKALNSGDSLSMTPDFELA